MFDYKVKSLSHTHTHTHIRVILKTINIRYRFGRVLGTACFSLALSFSLPPGGTHLGIFHSTTEYRRGELARACIARATITRRELTYLYITFARHIFITSGAQL